ncbi:MAG: hypothetical protein JOZ24_11745, partial [Candidatus Eremiobacteraeota bacterium]|nr:hypothetical protein [Candidatus Eremiobacteraeota bacterium]
MNETLFTEYPGAIDAIRRYLRAALPHAELTEGEDFERDGIRFRIEPGRLVFFSHEFLSDFSEAEAAARLKSWRVGNKAQALDPGLTLFVTTEGTFV